MARKEFEGIYEKYLRLFMPIWLPVEAIKIMVKDMISEKSKKKGGK